MNGKLEYNNVRVLSYGTFILRVVAIDLQEASYTTSLITNQVKYINLSYNGNATTAYQTISINVSIIGEDGSYYLPSSVLLLYNYDKSIVVIVPIQNGTGIANIYLPTSGNNIIIGECNGILTNISIYASILTLKIESNNMTSVTFT